MADERLLFSIVPSFTAPAAAAMTAPAPTPTTAAKRRTRGCRGGIEARSKRLQVYDLLNVRFTATKPSSEQKALEDWLQMHPHVIDQWTKDEAEFEAIRGGVRTVAVDYANHNAIFYCNAVTRQVELVVPRSIFLGRVVNEGVLLQLGKNKRLRLHHAAQHETMNDVSSNTMVSTFRWAHSFRKTDAMVQASVYVQQSLPEAFAPFKTHAYVRCVRTGIDLLLASIHATHRFFATTMLRLTPNAHEEFWFGIPYSMHQVAETKVVPTSAMEAVSAADVIVPPSIVPPPPCEPARQKEAR